MEHFECKKCSEPFQSKINLKKHSRLKHGLELMKDKIKTLAIERERNLSDLKINILAKICKVKEQEILRKHSCYCKSYCRIHHGKHNFNKSKADEFEMSLKKHF